MELRCTPNKDTSKSDYFKYDFSNLQNTTILLDDVTGHRSNSKLITFIDFFTANKSSSKLNLFMSLQTAQKTGQISLIKPQENTVIFTFKQNRFLDNFRTLIYRENDTDKFITKQQYDIVNKEFTITKQRRNLLMSIVFYTNNNIVCSESVFNKGASNFLSIS